MSAWTPELFAAVGPVASTIGTLWVNALRMTVLPLVVALLITGVVSVSDAGLVGRVGGRALALMVAWLLAGAAIVGVIAPLLIAALPLDASAVATLRASSAAPAGAVTPPGLGAWLVDLLPANPIKALADGALLPVVIFTMLFAVAALRIGAEKRAALVAFFAAVADTMLVLVRWVLELAVIGVFALALPLGARLGAAAGAIAGYVVLSAACCLVLLVALYAGAVIFGGVPLSTFARAAAPAQAVAAGSRSSLASLPAMIQGIERHLRLPPAATGFFLPLAVSTFRMGSTVAVTLGTLFLARLYGVPLDAGDSLSIALAAVLLSFAVPGVPGGSILVMAPLHAGLGIPLEGTGILLAIDALPDVFRTMTNVTGDVTVATILGRWETPPAVAALPTR